MRRVGIGAALRAFDHPAANPADTIYLYTTSRVLIALDEARQAGLIADDRDIATEGACAIKTLFDYDPSIPRLRYSDNTNDDPYLVYNVFADMARANIRLAAQLGDDALLDGAKSACRILTARVEADGSVPYLEGGRATDPTHHAMVTNGLFECADRFALPLDQAYRAAAFFQSRFIGDNGQLIGAQPDVEWAVGEGLHAMTVACRHDQRFCGSIDLLLAYVGARESDGLVNNNDARFQSWLAAGLSYALDAGEQQRPVSAP